MRQNTLQYQYTTGRFTLPVVYFICTLCWIIAGFFTPAKLFSATSGNPIWEMIPFDWIPNWVLLLGAYVTLSIVGYILIQQNNQFTIITQRATVQSSLYLVFITAIPQVHIIQPGVIAGLCFSISTFFLFYSYKEWDSMIQQFFAAIFMSFLFLLIPKMILLFPLLILTKIVFNNLNIRTFFATLLGFILPLWFLLAHAIWHDQMDLFTAPFLDLMQWGQWNDYSNLQGKDIATFGYILFITILSLAYILFSKTRMRVRTRQILNHFLRITLGIVVLIVFTPKQLNSYIPIWLICISFIYGHALVSIHSKLTNLIFLGTILLLAVLFVYNTWML
ncbi:hypothetical protein Bcop_0324 [Bacteroides coprosuis DSM 18011]|uniref:Transmembrane protein n=1 Tax=Bacteroides coprosuis DSM 18011 TaxID=679937 RepID=F3ZQG5_9BACE|nr:MULTISPECIES: hypothetical protein [Bacteroides]EGJ70543.1 hypothetical protein Bcop_0324 [Bacteroides coprosuis DSM 18011]HJD92672.1 hypothetical protein [Bacteroides coprosuis]